MNLTPNFIRRALNMPRVYKDWELSLAIDKSCHYVAKRYRDALDLTQSYSQDQLNFFYQEIYSSLSQELQVDASQCVFIGMVPMEDSLIPTENLRDALLASGMRTNSITYLLQFMLYPGTVYDRMAKKFYHFDV